MERVDGCVALVPLYADLLNATAPNPDWGKHPLFQQWRKCPHAIADRDYLTLLNYLQRCYARSVIIRLSGGLAGDNNDEELS